jgi:hypothetical protein
VFIVGCYNSGTTLLQRLLSKHPDISSLPKEGVKLTSELPRPEEFGWTRMWAECLDKITFEAKKDVEKTKKIILDWSPFFDKSSPVFLEKSISNLPRIEWLNKNFENVYFIGIIRNPYAVASGIRNRARPRAPVNKLYGEKYPIRLTAGQWLIANTMMIEKMQVVKRFKLIKYEDLVSFPVKILKDIFNYLHLKFPRIEFSNDKLRIEKYTEPIINMNSKSIDKLSEDDFNSINSVIGTKLNKFGYHLNGKMVCDLLSEKKI